MFRVLLQTLALALWLGGWNPVLAQGSDDCSGAQVISGTGQYFFDNSNATVDGVDNGCNMAFDVWFQWSRASDFRLHLLHLRRHERRQRPGRLRVHRLPQRRAPGLRRRSVRAPVRGGARGDRRADLFDPAGDLGLGRERGHGFSLHRSRRRPGGLRGSRPWAERCGGGPGRSGGLRGRRRHVRLRHRNTACNLGDQELLWQDGNGAHPVLGHNLYRLEDGRFEQLGASWVKHGFAALQRELCCSCIPSASISALGVGCSDPYGAVLNGTQFGLGPRTEVNGFSGAFSWPPGAATGVPPASGILARRLQVPTADMDPSLHPSARFFAEAVYAAPDDAASGNGFDNASYREYVRTGDTEMGAFRLAPVDVTERGLPAVAAWASLVPTVRLEEVRVPGRERSGWRVTRCPSAPGAGAMPTPSSI